MYVRSSLAILAVAAAMLMGAPAAAQQAQTPPTDQSAQAKPKDPNEMVCERQQDPGSRLAAAKVCHTRAEWADLRHQDRQMIDRAQTQIGAMGK
jgi:invasion protein IalB